MKFCVTLLLTVSACCKPAERRAGTCTAESLEDDRFIAQAIEQPDPRGYVVEVREWQWIEAQNQVPRAARFQRQVVPGDLCGALEGGTYTVLAYRGYEMVVRYDQPAGRVRGGSICPSGAVTVMYQDTP